MATYFEILCGVAALLVALYYYATSTFNFWKNRGVPGPRPLPFLGTNMDLMFARRAMAHFITDVYSKYKNEPIVGLYMGKRPLVVLNDPELIRDVLIRDFSKFSNRTDRVHEKTDPMSQHLFNLEAERWRPLRSKLTPIFTSGKLREMFCLIIECSHQLEKYLEKEIQTGKSAECNEITAKFTTDVIGSCAFGIETRAIEDEQSEFRKVGREIFAVNLENLLRIKMEEYAPKIYDWVGYLIQDRKFAPFFTKIVTDAIKYRKENNILRPDFINALMELQEHPDKLENIKMTDTLLAAQAFLFFAAGFETSSSTMSNTLYELALHQDVQDKLRKEIREQWTKSNGHLKYEDVKGMKYLDQVFKETLRLYPPGAVLLRIAMSDYTFNDTKVTIPKGTPVWIPVFAIQRDPDIYPNPNTFDPERFSEEAVAARHPMYYLPFGDGPRNCLGVRFATYQSKIGLCTILRNHKVDVCEKTKIPYEFDPAAFMLAPKGGIHLKITKLES